MLPYAHLHEEQCHHPGAEWTNKILANQRESYSISGQVAHQAAGRMYEELALCKNMQWCQLVQEVLVAPAMYVFAVYSKIKILHGCLTLIPIALLER
jgi:hypothetical protein